MKKLFYLIAMALTPSFAMADIPTVTVYADCSKNGYSIETGTAIVNSSAGRSSCNYVQLWEGGPKWATFNVGATITDYDNLTIGADPTPFNDYTYLAPYYNTANVGGLYPWMNPYLNGRKTTWTDTVHTGISDVATALWGSNWETPTKEQLDTLRFGYGKTTCTQCDGSNTQYVKGCTLKGYKVTGVGAYASYSIFLPATGSYSYYEGTIQHVQNIAYWSSTVSDLRWAYYLGPLPGEVGRMLGVSVRALLCNNTTNNAILTLYTNGCEAANVITCPRGQQMLIKTEDATNYRFAQWNDGNKSNPRLVTMNSNATYTAQIVPVKCGNDLTWNYSDGTLVISGTGAMYDYEQSTAPWMVRYKDEITSVVINNGCTSIGNYAFYGLSNKNFKILELPNSIEKIGQYAFSNCAYLKNLTLNQALEQISANAFAGDERLLYITCFAEEPPLLDESAFENYDV